MAFENLKKTGITYLLVKLKDIFLLAKDAIKSVNGNEADENGNIELVTIPYAQNLQSASNQRTDGEYIERTAGGTASIVTGMGSLIKILGNSTHEGYVAESIEMTVTPVDPDDPNAITATINEATFKSQVFESGTTTFTYGEGSWDSDPATYGITVTGTPVAGDVIEVVYVMEERGTIYVANPMGLVTTGWNLYNNDTGYARVLKYSDNPDEKFGISGTYTALKFSETLDGAQTDITVSGGLFSVPSDGYVFVSGGNATDTAIWMTWSDWTEGYDGAFVAYNVEEIDFSNEMASYFPYGLLKAGSVVDELNFNIGSAISRVERLAYSAGNRAIAEASGREYEFDTDYIYLERETPVTNEIEVDNEIRVNDHGMESVSYTDIPVEVEMLYGVNLKNRLEHDTVTISGHLENDLLATTSGKALDARQGKILNDKINGSVSATIKQSGTDKIFLNKVGNVVICNINGFAISNSSNSDFIPSGFRPAVDSVAFALMYKSNSDNYIANLNINANGNFIIRRKNGVDSRDTTVSGYSLYGTISWLC